LAEGIANATSPATVTALTAKLDDLAAKRSALKRQEADAQLRHRARMAAVKQAADLEE
jgi:hypothetical protein